MEDTPRPVAELARFTPDVDAAARFYERLLGVKPVHRGEGIAIFRTGPTTILIHETYEPAGDQLPCEDHTAFRVANLEETCNELTREGYELEHPPRDYDWGRSAYLRDPDGRLIELAEKG